MTNNAIYYKSLILVSAAVIIIMMLLSPKAHTESPSQFKAEDSQTRQDMIVISRQLGVTCTECHNVQNFASSDKKTFKVAKDHMRIVALLKSNGFDGKKGPEASCYMCHQGDLKPDFKESLGK